MGFSRVGSDGSTDQPTDWPEGGAREAYAYKNTYMYTCSCNFKYRKLKIKGALSGPKLYEVLPIDTSLVFYSSSVNMKLEDSSNMIPKSPSSFVPFPLS